VVGFDMTQRAANKVYEAAGVGPDETRFRSAVGRASATLVEQAAA